jgi:hypothetical protein
MKTPTTIRTTHPHNPFSEAIEREIDEYSRDVVFAKLIRDIMEAYNSSKIDSTEAFRLIEMANSPDFENHLLIVSILTKLNI